MTRFHHGISGIILLALFFSGGIVSAAEGDADLNVSKAVSSAGPYEPGDEITWVVTLWNNGPAHATNISLTEDVSELSGLVTSNGVADYGTYDNATRIWSISELDADTFSTLTLITKFETGGEKTNAIAITALDQTDPEPGNNHADATVVINNAAAVIPDQPLSVNLAIKPTTMNLNSKGVFTVFVSLNGITPESSADIAPKSRIDYKSSSLTCGEAEMVRASVSNKDGGTLIAKFHRYDLENVTSGEGVMINCSGTILVNGATIPVEGSDTIRVIGEKKGLDKFLTQLSKFLGIEKDDIEINESEDSNITVTFTLNPNNFKNPGQAKKLSGNQETGSDPAPSNETAVPGQTRGSKEKPVKNNRDDQQIRQNNAENKPVKDNNGSDKGNSESPGKSNGKKNK
jgi:uncharacterized repeat protein (TIGR01451 family)